MEQKAYEPVTLEEWEQDITILEEAVNNTPHGQDIFFRAWIIEFDRKLRELMDSPVEMANKRGSIELVKRVVGRMSDWMTEVVPLVHFQHDAARRYMHYHLKLITDVLKELS